MGVVTRTRTFKEVASCTESFTRASYPRGSSTAPPAATPVSPWQRAGASCPCGTCGRRDRTPRNAPPTAAPSPAPPSAKHHETLLRRPRRRWRAGGGGPEGTRLLHLRAVASALVLVERRHQGLAVDGVAQNLLLHLVLVGGGGVVAEGVVRGGGALSVRGLEGAVHSDTRSSLIQAFNGVSSIG